MKTKDGKTDLLNGRVISKKLFKGNMFKTTLTGESEVLFDAACSSCAVGSASIWPSSESISSDELSGGASTSELGSIP